MGGRSGSVRNRTGVEGNDFKLLKPLASLSGNGVLNLTPLIDNLPNNRLNTQIRKAISTIAARYGIAETRFNLADLGGAYGVNVRQGSDNFIALSRSRFQNPTQVRTAKLKAYEKGWSVKTRNPLQHTIVHEMAHAKWIDQVEGNKFGFRARVQKLFKTYRTEARALGARHGRKNYAKFLPLGEYATTTINEFWAEAVTHHIIGGGKKNKYSTEIGKIWEAAFRKKRKR